MLENISRFYNETVDVMRNTPTANNIGGFKDNWSVHIADLACRIRPLQETEKYVGDKQTLYATHKLYCSVVDIKETDKIIDTDNKEYLVKGVINPMRWNNHLQVDLEYVRDSNG